MDDAQVPDTEAPRTPCAGRGPADAYLDVAEVIMVALDRGGRVTLINRKGREVLGYTADELTGRDWFDACIPEGSREPVRAVFAEIMAGRIDPVEYYENHVVGKDGQERLVAWHNAILKDDDGRIAGTLSSGQDITERRRVEESLRASEARHRSLLEHMGEGVMQVDNDDRLLFVNERLCRMLGWHPEDLLGKIGNEVLCVDESARELIKEKNRLRRAGISDVYETTMRRSDGTVLWVSISGAPVYGQDGAITGSVGLITDITDRNLAEAALRTSEAFSQAVIENSPIGISVRSRTGRLLSANAAWKRIWAIPEPAMSDDVSRERQSLAFNHRDDYLRPYQAEVRRVYEQGGHLRIPELRIGQFRQGAAEWIAQHFYAICSADGAVERVVILTEDITERKRAEEERERLREQLIQAQKMESVGRLAGGVAHDFNNMLQVVLGHTDLALSKIGAAHPLHADLDHIRTAAARSADLTRQLLAFARRQTAAPRVLNLNDTVDGMLTMLRRLIGEDVELRWMPGDALWNVRIDPTQFDQILANLCVNARDAIGGVGVVTLETGNVCFGPAHEDSPPGVEAGAYVMLTIRDTGCGMGQEVLDHLFEPFFTTKDAGRGTGLGLSTVYGIVKQNAGFVHVTSEPGSGTAFMVYLPRCGDECPAPEPASEPDARPGGAETVLLVEDDGVILDMATLMLEALGYVVLAAGTPGSAIRRAETHSGDIHLLITDVIMPEMNGRELAGRIEALRPGIRCLFISGYPSDVIAHHGVLDEGVHFMPKPFTVGALAAKVRAVLEG
ncbi:MAG: PAS domain S-box protein [Candidatus Eisenbacteria bacterium]|nr:PAS domain S-box protein [Candidatus Eisenbacteria bacterium]